METSGAGGRDTLQKPLVSIDWREIFFLVSKSTSVNSKIIFKVIFSISCVYHKLLNTVPRSIFPRRWRCPHCTVSEWIQQHLASCSSGLRSAQAQPRSSTGFSLCLSGHSALFPLRMSRKAQYETLLVVDRPVMVMGAVRQPCPLLTDPLQGTADPHSQDDGTSGKAYFRKGKMPLGREE